MQWRFLKSELPVVGCNMIVNVGNLNSRKLGFHPGALKKLARTGKAVLDLLIPSVCLHCGARLFPTEKWLCGKCCSELPELPEAVCAKCGSPQDPDFCPDCEEMQFVFEKAVAVYAYDGAAKTLIHALKYHNRTAVADWLAEKAFEKLDWDRPFAGAEVVTSIPLHKVRQRERGYNQSALLAQALAKRMKLPFEPYLMVRKVYTTSQTTLSKAARLQNLKEAFRLGKSSLAGKKVLLVDDVFTTGTTVNEAAKVLLAGGAGSVYVLTICHGTL